MMNTHRNQRGTTVVEFAIVGAVFFTVLFALIDFSRLFWNLAALDEATRRGARVAAVCPVNEVNKALVQQVALFGGVVPGLGTKHIVVEYLEEDGTDAFDEEDGGGYGAIRYVRVSIQDFQLQTFIPGLQSVLPAPAFTTTIPSESLGRVGTDDVDC
jgi:hypothetical protein